MTVGHLRVIDFVSLFLCALWTCIFSPTLLRWPYPLASNPILNNLISNMQVQNECLLLVTAPHSLFPNGLKIRIDHLHKCSTASYVSWQVACGTTTILQFIFKWYWFSLVLVCTYVPQFSFKSYWYSLVRHQQYHIIPEASFCSTLHNSREIS
jgi:hypothetical protein